MPVISKPDDAPVQVLTPGPPEESLLENDNQGETNSSTSSVTKWKNMLVLNRKDYPSQSSLRHKLSRIEKKELKHVSWWRSIQILGLMRQRYYDGWKKK